MVPEEQQAILPDTAEITRDLEYMTARWGELDQPAMFELRAFKEGVAPKTAKFSPDWIEDAADWAESMNSLGYNLYAVRNPIRSDLTGSAADSDIIAAFFLWADCDDPAAVDNVRRFDGPQCSASVVTGEAPSTRVHLYWQLSEPVTDMASWRDMQTRIAAHFGSDRTVVNPSRIMRLGGTVAYPAKHKVERGYQKFLTTFRNSYSTPRDPVSFDQMGRVFKDAPQSATQPAQSGFHVDTGPQPLDRALASANILAGTDWRENVKKLVASYVARGWTDDEIVGRCLAFTLPGWTADDTARDVASFIKWTREQEAAKGGKYAASPTLSDEQFRPSPEAVDTDSSGVITGLKIQSSAEFLSDLSPAVYVVDGVLAKRRCLSLTGYAGHGKTTLALHLAIQVATGGQFGGQDCEKGSCLILAGENPDNVKWQYAAACAAAGVGTDLPIHFLPGHFQLSGFLDDLLTKARQIPDLQLVIIDSLQAFFEGENDNGNVEMMEAARRFRTLSEIESGPSVVVIAHPAGKRPDKSNIVPRGGSAFGNEFDGNLTVWAEPDGTQIFHHSEKFRGAPFDPLPFVMEDREFDHLKDHKGRHMRLKVSRMQMIIEQANAAQKSERREKDAIAAIEANPTITQRALSEALGVSKSTADRVMQALKDEKLIRRHARKWVLTDGGKEFLNGE